MPQFVKRETIAAEAWDEVVHASDDGWVYALHGWQELILAVKEWGLVEASFGIEENGALVAVVPLQFNPAARVLGSSAWGGCGPILRNGLGTKERARLLDLIFEQCGALAAEHGAGGLEFSQPAISAASLANDRGVNRFQFHGFEDRSGLTQVVDLRPDVEALWAGLSKNARHIIRRAEKSGLSVAAVDWREHLERYYALHCETYHRTGVPPHPFAYFEGIAGHTGASGHSRLSAAFDSQGIPIAYHNDAVFGAGALYHTGCSANRAQNSGANYLLLWHAIRAARETGCIAYEVGPIFPDTRDPKQQGLTLFKTRFGGEPHRALRSFRSYDAAVCSEAGGRGRARSFLRAGARRFLNRFP